MKCEENKKIERQNKEDYRKYRKKRMCRITGSQRRKLYDVKNEY